MTMLYKKVTGEKVPFLFREVSEEELREKRDTHFSSWSFDFLLPKVHGNKVFALVTELDQETIQGLIALRLNDHPQYMCVDVDIIESAPHNKKIRNAVYNPSRYLVGVGRCLIAFACQYGIENNLDAMQLTSKSSKLKWYTDLGGLNISGQQIIFMEDACKELAQSYFPRGVIWC
ncbi:hypothetical protein [Bacillus safensis]|uniref:hypothetical protein n=1 Tax=Bacillus safensis TaxID=561879 RepID=UPI002E210F09|nr:hypothetical protein [Bacillus safensis]